MSGSKCAYLENVALNIILGGTTWTAPATVYVALSTNAFNVNATGSALTEVSSSGTAYARVAVTNDSTNWPAASSSVKANGTAFTFPAATAGWGTILSFYIIDAASSGNALYGADLSVSRVVNTGDTASFSIGAITLTET